MSPKKSKLATTYQKALSSNYFISLRHRQTSPLESQNTLIQLLSEAFLFKTKRNH